MSLSEIRTAAFRRNELLERLLAELGDDLQPSEKLLLSRYGQAEMQFPLVLVMGALRSGTTLFTQWLANLGLVAYPTNLLARFYQTPIIGAKIQLLLTDPRYNFRDELGAFVQQAEYRSENGKTKGVLAPNEFWYFWRRFLKEPTRDVWTEEELRATMDTQTLLAEVVGLMDIFQKPFAAKGMLFNYNIPFLDSIFAKVLFVQIKRDPVANVASILEARRRQLGSEKTWYSFKIPEYEMLKDLEPIGQSAGQLYYINKAVTQGLAVVAEPRRLVVQYEDFCANPRAVFERFREKIGLAPSVEYKGERQFVQTRTNIMADRNTILQALETFEGES